MKLRTADAPIGTVESKVSVPSKSFAINRAQAISSGRASDGKKTALPMKPLMKQMVKRVGDNRVGVAGTRKIPYRKARA